MAIFTKRFTLSAPGNEEIVTQLSKFIGVRPLCKDWAGRQFFSMPAPYQHLYIYDGETLTPEKSAELARAIGYFQAMSGGDVDEADRRFTDALRNGNRQRKP